MGCSIMISQRRLVILEKIIYKNGLITLKELMADEAISERTLRNELQRLHEFLIKSGYKGLEKEYGGKIKLLDIEKIKNDFLKKRAQIELSPTEREDYLICYCVFNKTINLEELSDELDVSRTTIVNYFKNVKSFFYSYGIIFKNANKSGLTLESDEDSIRRVILKMYFKYYSGISTNNFLAKYLESNLKKLDIQGIEDFIKNISEKFNRVISDEAYKVIKVYLQILISRVMAGNILKKVGNENFLRKTDEFLVVKDSVKIIEDYYGMELEENEILRVLDFILGSHTYNFETSYFENWIEIELLVKKIISNFSRIYKYDLSGDKVLLEGLINHIKPTIYRLKNNIELQNSIYKDVIKNYYDILDVLRLAIYPLEEFLKLEVSDDELAFLTLHFKVALENKMKREIKNILVVCTYGYGSSKLLAQQLRENFNVNIIDIIPFNKLSVALDDNDIDLIISTIEIGEEVGIKSIKVNAILTDNDILNLINQGVPKHKKRFVLSEIISGIEKHCTVNDLNGLKKELLEIFKHRIIEDEKSKIITIKDLTMDGISLGVKCKNWEEAIKISGELLEKQGFVQREYTNEMIETINKYGSYIVLGDKVAIPHAKALKTDVKTGFGIVVLEKPIAFPNNKFVDILIPFSSKDGIEHLEFLKDVNYLVNEESFLEMLRTAKGKENVIEYIEFYEREHF